MVIEALEAKTRLSALLDRVARGEEIVITKHGRPVARLVPAAPREDVGAIIARIKVLRVGQTLGGLSSKDLRDEGRR
jgi:prevent-host-death family protein